MEEEVRERRKLVRETHSVWAWVGGTEGEEREWRRVALLLLFIEDEETFPCEMVDCLFDSKDLLLCNETCCDITRSVTAFESVLSRLEC